MTHALIQRLAVFRRRATLMTLASTAVVTGVGAVGASVLLARVLGWPASLLTCLAGALVVTTLATLAGHRSIRTIAAQIDDRSHLSDRVVTALEQRNAADPMGRLLLRDTLARLEMLSPREVFPFHTPRHFGKVATAALVAAILGLAAPASLFPTRQTAPADGDSVSASSATSTMTATSKATASAAAPGENAVEQKGEKLEAAQAKATQSPAAAGKAPESARASTPVDPARDTPARPALDARAGQLTSRGENPTPSARTTTEAGGVSASDRDGHVAARRMRGSPAVAPALSLDAAGSAVEQQRLPPGLRAYVRTYFEAIRK